MKSLMKIDMAPLTKGLQDVLKRTDKETKGKAVLAGLFVLEGHAKLNVKKNFKQGTGFLSTAWETMLDNVSEDNVEGHTAPLAVYARIQELGGVIKATNAESLAFEIDGNFIRVKAVTIPARPYLRPAADENKNQIFDAVGFVLKKSIEDK